jgi:hypothetical protein
LLLCVYLQQQLHFTHQQVLSLFPKRSTPDRSPKTERTG